MRRIFFFSRVFDHYCKNKNAGREYIVDYYDIEVQRVLYSIGFRFKMSPCIYCVSNNSYTHLVHDMYDLDHYVFVEKLEGDEVRGVIYVCR